MSEDELISVIASIQRAPVEDYVLWAELGDGDLIALRTVQMPLGFSTEVSLQRLKAFGRESLAAAGVIGHEADAVRYHLGRLPTVEELKAQLDPLVAGGEELALLNFPTWEAARIRLHLKTENAEFGTDPELDYRGLKLRRSAVS